MGSRASLTGHIAPVILLGLAIAVGVNRVPKMLKGPTIVISLLPMIVTPLVGALILFWMVAVDGILGTAIQWLFNGPNPSMKASTPLVWTMLIFYGM